MERLRVGDYVIFKHGESSLTGLVSRVIDKKGLISYEIIPSAIGLDSPLTVVSSSVKKATPSYDA